MRQWTRVCGAVGLCSVLVQCTNRPAPAAGGGGSAEETVGRFVWQELVTDDVASSQRFYGALLGWEFEATTRLGKPYVLVRANGNFVAGITPVERDRPDEPIAQWLSYLRVEDVDSAVAAAERAGGEVLVSPVALADSARAAVVTDALGAPLGLLSFDEDLPIVPESSPLQPFLWRDYLAPDVDAALDFYTSARGYDAERVTASSRPHYVLREPSSTSPVGGIVAIGDASVRASWLPFVRVQDPAALAQRASELGGQVLLEPNPALRGGGLAIVADPNGAPLALQMWPLGS